MGADDLILLYKVIWEQGDIWSRVLVCGVTLAWVICTLQYLFCKKEIKEDDTVEAQAAKEKDNKKVSSDAWQFSLILVSILVFHWYKFGMDDLLVKMIFQNMYK